ncbi:hypothetical protein B0T19DRAFT_441037 [Cercophora scortea]|uniref:Uncharacterized protein n=1 Tax=Cercophora scortea TaxID=314031 RepID=A0AAE0IL25_9PEZI|nr:hypothetical protein B0T19DRAFT_441037 [Cercophora scortea]
MTMDRHVGWVDEYQNSHASPLDGDSEQTSRILSNESSPFRHGANMQGPTSFINVDFASSHFSYPPPPPPLTPPTLSTTIPPFENRRLGSPVSIHHGLETNFIHQPNPDYDVSSSTSTDIPLYSPDYAHSIADTSTTAIPRRRSYTRAVPIGIPASTSSPIAGGNTFSPSSYPPTSPMLPPPPPGYDGGDEGFPPPPSEYQFVGGPGGPGIVLSEEVMDMDMDIRLHGEIVSVMDDAGHGWKRHTRVYGGGVCLACIAAANGGGSREGGFYGDRVPLADRR